MRGRAEALNPDSKLPRVQQYALAWGLLEGHAAYPNVTWEEKAQAKCWLTYRTAEAEINLRDWTVKVSAVEVALPDSDMGLRWTHSQHVAEVYVNLLVGDIQAGLRTAASVAAELLKVLPAWPPLLLHWVRLQAVLAYDEMLTGRSGLLTERYQATASVWCRQMAGVSQSHLPDHPFRWAESVADVRALQAMVFMLCGVGVCSFEPVSWMSWNKLDQLCGGELWWRCLRRLAAKPGNLFNH